MLLIPLAASAPVLFALAGQQFSEGNPLGAARLAARGAGAGGRSRSSAARCGRFRQPGTAIVHAALGIFTLVYVGLLVSFLALLRLFHEQRSGACSPCSRCCW